MNNTYNDALEIAQEHMKLTFTGCCWHIVLADGNIEMCHVYWCIGNIAKKQCQRESCKELAYLLPRLTEDERHQIYEECY